MMEMIGIQDRKMITGIALAITVISMYYCFSRWGSGLAIWTYSCKADSFCCRNHQQIAG